MALLSFDDELERAREKVPFSNGFEYDSWSSIWCDECVHFEDCPLLLVIMHEKTPAAWEDVAPHALNRYHCHEFTQESAVEEPQVQEQESARPTQLECAGPEHQQSEAHGRDGNRPAGTQA